MFVEKSNSLQRAREFAEEYAGNAVASLLQLPASPSQSALIALIEKVLVRQS